MKQSNFSHTDNITGSASEMKDKKNMIGKVLWVAAVLIAAGMIAFGAVSGEATTVFNKAATICMECIGLG